MINPNKQLTFVFAEQVGSLVKLYEALGFQAEHLQLKQPSKQALILESLTTNDVSVRNIEQVTLAIAALQKLVEDRELEAWSDGLTFERQKAELEEQLNKLQELNDKNEQLEQQVAVLEETVTRLKSYFPEREKLHASDKEKQWIGFVREIIHVRDSLAMKEELLKEEENHQETKAWKLVQALYRETEGILTRMKVMVIRQEGIFDSNTQMVTDTTPTDQENLHDTVAQTFREGYRTADRLIRPQEVILFSYKG